MCDDPADQRIQSVVIAGPVVGFMVDDSSSDPCEKRMAQLFDRLVDITVLLRGKFR
jgi:hypothetical protein